MIVLTLPAAVGRNNPYAGTWKMNLAQSRYPSGAAPREQTAIITQAGTDLDHQIVGTSADGAKISARIVIPITDGPGKVLETAKYDGVSVTAQAKSDL